MSTQERVYIKMSGDERDLVRAAKKSDEALAQMVTRAKEVTDTTVAGAARERQAREQLLRLYREQASTAEHGSARQAAALKLVAAEEHKLGIQTAENTQKMNLFGHSVDRSARGAIAGSGAFRSMGRSLVFASTAFLGAAGFTTVLRQSITAASDLHEQVNKSNVVFRENAGVIRAWSKTTATSLGLADVEAIKFAGTFGNMLIPMGIAPKQAATMSVALVKLAADMASFNNIPVEEALEKIQSGLAGMPRPLREVGVFLDQTRIKAEALTSGLVKGNVDLGKVRDAQTAVAVATANLAAAQAKYGPGTTQVAEATITLHKAQSQLAASVSGTIPPLTTAQKTMAAYQIIMKDTAIQHGDFARTSDGLANRLRILHAQVMELEASLGEALMPTVLSVVGGMTDWLGQTENQERVTKDLHLAVDAVRTTIDGLVTVVQNVDKVTGSFKDTMELLIGLAIVSKLAAWTKAFTLLAGSEAAGIGAAGAAGQVGALRASLVRLALLRAIVIPLAIKLIDDRTGGKIGDFNIWLYENVTRPVTKALTLGKYDPGAPIDKNAPKPTPGGSTYTPRTLKQSGKVQLPATFQPTHETGGLPGFGAVDIFAEPGTTVLAPEDGVLFDAHFIAWNTAKRTGGWTIYYQGHESGNTYFMTHFATVGPTGSYRKGQKIGTVAKVPGQAWAPHIHVGEHTGLYTPPMGAAPAYSSGGPGGGAPPTAPAGGGDLKVGKPPKVTKGTDIAAGSSLQLSDKLTAAQKAVAQEIYQVATSHGLTPQQALQLVAAAYAESSLDPNRVNKQSGARGLFQFLSKGYEAAYRYYRSLGFDIVTAETLAILLGGHGNEGLPTYGAYFKAHPGAPAGAAAAAVEGSGAGAAFYRKGIGSLFTLGSGGGATAAARVKPAPTRAAVSKELRELTDVVAKLPDDLIASISPKVIQIGKLFEKMVTAQNRRVVMAQIVALKKQVITELRTFEDSAWASIRDTILKAYDEKVIGRVAGNRAFATTQLGQAQAQKKYDRAKGTVASLGAAGLTPAMQAIKEKGDAVLDAWNLVFAATAGTMKDTSGLERAVGQLAEAQNQFESIGGDLTDTEQAYLAAYQAMIESKQALGEGILDKWQKAEEARTTLARKGVQKSLNKVYADLRSGKITLAQAEAALNDILAPLGLSLADLGDVLDTTDLQDALSDLQGAIEGLTSLLGGGGGGGGPAGPDPRATPAPGRPGGVQTPEVFSSQVVGGGGSGPAPAPTPIEVTVNVNVTSTAELDGQQVATVVSNEVTRRIRRGGTFGVLDVV